ncbi:uncharacterized protein LOC125750717 [Brienomyrus brachyistius]|uniref:uncharacterized protein LOC125750717 n=1 Tax=Brienomyrus brachyistius TaxID=42636 RepID=UPI0020B23BA2|nr:uncharacterized protein LOC125750717 [Brienomyrus brachyistius]
MILMGFCLNLLPETSESGSGLIHPPILYTHVSCAENYGHKAGNNPGWCAHVHYLAMPCENWRKPYFHTGRTGSDSNAGLQRCETILPIRHRHAPPSWASLLPCKPQCQLREESAERQNNNNVEDEESSALWSLSGPVSPGSSRDSRLPARDALNVGMCASRYAWTDGGGCNKTKASCLEIRGPICERHLHRWPAGGAAVWRLRAASRRAKHRDPPYRHLPVCPHSAAALRSCRVGKGQPSFQMGTVTRHRFCAKQTLGGEWRKLHLGANGTGVARGPDVSTCRTVYIALTQCSAFGKSGRCPGCVWETLVLRC